MLEKTAIVLVLLWLAGLAASCTFHGYVHLLLVVALVLIVVRVVRGNDPLQ